MPERFQQRQLASSLVGTPGVDTSAGVAEAQIAETAQKTRAVEVSARLQQLRQAESDFNTARVLTFYGQLQQNATKNAQEQRLLTADIGTKASKLGFELNSLSETLKQENLSNPQQAIEIFKTKSANSINEILKDVPEKLRPLYNKMLVAQQVIEAKSLDTWKYTQGKKNADADFDRQSEMIKAQAAALGLKGGNEESFQKLKAMQLPAISMQAEAALGVPVSNKDMANLERDINASYIKGLIESDNPRVALLKVKEFVDTKDLDADKSTALINTAQKAVKDKEKEDLDIAAINATTKRSQGRTQIGFALTKVTGLAVKADPQKMKTIAGAELENIQMLRNSWERDKKVLLERIAAEPLLQDKQVLMQEVKALDGDITQANTTIGTLSGKIDSAISRIEAERRHQEALVRGNKSDARIARQLAAFAEVSDLKAEAQQPGGPADIKAYQDQVKQLVQQKIITPAAGSSLVASAKTATVKEQVAKVKESAIPKVAALLAAGPKLVKTRKQDNVTYIENLESAPALIEAFRQEVEAVKDKVTSDTLRSLYKDIEDANLIVLEANNKKGKQRGSVAHDNAILQTLKAHQEVDKRIKAIVPDQASQIQTTQLYKDAYQRAINFGLSPQEASRRAEFYALNKRGR